MQKLEIQEVGNGTKVVEVNKKENLVDRIYWAMSKVKEFKQMSLDRQGELTVAIMSELQTEKR